MKKMKKILLIDPPTTRSKDFGAEKLRIGLVPPLGLAYIAAVLEKENYVVKILDCTAEGYFDEINYAQDKIRYGLTDESIKTKITEFSPDLVGVSCLFSNKSADLHNVCRIVKEVNKNVVIVVGGVHPTVLPERTLKDKNIDFVILGEGEYTFRDIINTLNEDGDLSKIDGIGYRKNKKITIIPKTKFIDNLDELPLPARHLLPMDIYSKAASPHSGFKRSPFTTMISSRGCPQRCTFCELHHLWGRKYRMRSSQKVLDEIEFLVKEYGIKEIHFEDDNLTANKKRALEIFNGIIERKLDITWSDPSGLSVFYLDDEILEKIKESGGYSISLAIESGDEYVLHHLMRKPVKLNDVKTIVNKARKIGLYVRGFFIIGSPEETKEQINNTVDFAKNLGLDWAHFFIFTPHYGTEMREICEKNNYIKKEAMDFEKWFFEPVIVTPEFNPEYLTKIKEEVNLEINFKNNINMKEGNYDKAIADFSYVISLYPKLDFAHFYLGCAYNKKGLIDKAKVEWEETLRLNPTHAEAKAILRSKND
ncbi:MAG TPA: cobalamin-dependent protein [Candidatus Limnocylindrales bacterium]|nr:cobalamin-dependent protein [Candidatus Limnocylindrales bacterium]